jgi:3,4-dihydroxy 2-butanone 4-phosphate synthase/GTP cyclohydrolase II
VREIEVAGNHVGAEPGPALTDGFSTVTDGLDAFARGEIVIVVDAPDRENEGDFVMAAEYASPEAVNFMVTHGRGLLCMPMDPSIADALDLPLMVPGSSDAHGTAFTVSIDLADPPTTGISAHDRAACIVRAAAPGARPEEFKRPGHIFPLRAKDGGVLARAGHTEAAVDLARLAGLRPSGVVCEILNDDGSMARVPDLIEVARRHGLHLISIADLVAYRGARETIVRRSGQARIPTLYGEFTAIGFQTPHDGLEHLALVYGDPERIDGPLVRVHSECLTGDTLGSIRCDCGAQLQEALALIARAGGGVVVYLRGHEGRGIGLLNKLKAYTLQDEGADTVEANLALGLPADARTYGTAAQILRDLGLLRVRLLTNNPAKRAGLVTHGVDVVDRIPLQTPPTMQNLRYLEAKRDRLAHDLDLSLAEIV